VRLLTHRSRSAGTRHPERCPPPVGSGRPAGLPGVVGIRTRLPQEPNPPARTRVCKPLPPPPSSPPLPSALLRICGGRRCFAAQVLPARLRRRRPAGPNRLPLLPLSRLPAILPASPNGTMREPAAAACGPACHSGGVTLAAAWHALRPGPSEPVPSGRPPAVGLAEAMPASPTVTARLSVQDAGGPNGLR
jgi:hypothetical protein